MRSSGSYRTGSRTRSQNGPQQPDRCESRAPNCRGRTRQDADSDLHTYAVRVAPASPLRPGLQSDLVPAVSAQPAPDSGPRFRTAAAGSRRRQEEVSFSRMAYYAPTTTRSRPGVSVLVLVYLVAVGIVAATHHYWSQLNSVKHIVSALLATILWPLILVGVNLHIH